MELVTTKEVIFTQGVPKGITIF